MRNNKTESLFEKSFKEQQIILNDERYLNINEKTSHSVSKVMSWIMVALLFITGVVMKNYTCLLIIFHYCY